MNEIKDEVERLIEAVKNSETYKEYERQQNRVNDNPELKERIDRYRNEIFALQNDKNENNISNRMEEFAERYSDFLEIPEVSAYLDAENNLCRMMQELTDKVVCSLNFG